MTSLPDKEEVLAARPGDRVRITCEGVVKRFDASGSAVVLLDGADCDQDHLATVFTYTERTAPTFSMKVHPRPLEVGSRVAHVVSSSYRGNGTVEWLGEAGGEEFALVRWSDFELEVHPTGNLHPLTEEASHGE